MGETVHQLPATQAPRVVCEIMRALRANTSDNNDINPSKEETFSDRCLEA